MTNKTITALFILSIILNFSGCSDSKSTDKPTEEKVNRLIPNIAVYSPAQDSIIKNPDTDFTITFSELGERVKGKSFKIFKSENDVLHTSMDMRDFQVSESYDNNKTSITINPNMHLVYGKEHYIKIDLGAFQSYDGGKYVGIHDKRVWKFKVPDSNTFDTCGCNDLDNCDLPANLQ